MKSMQDLFNKTTLVAYLGSWGTMLMEWFSEVDISETIQGGVMLTTLVLGLMKMYDQYLITKERKRNDTI